jgi:putative ABC transport system ATP-binding protein
VNSAGADNTTPILLALKNICRTFPMGDVPVEALRDVSLEIQRGELLAVVGPSGSGKSTILNLIGGLDRPTAGTIWYDGRDLSESTAAELTAYRREEVGFIFQFYNLVPNLTARENILISTEISSQPLDVDEVLELVGLADRVDHFPAQLSGGEQQRVAIARAIAKNPQLLLCDEPTGALDSRTGQRVLQLLIDLKLKLNKTIVVITHNSALAQVADRVVYLRSGQVFSVDVNQHPAAPAEISW